MLRCGRVAVDCSWGSIHVEARRWDADGEAIGGDVPDTSLDGEFRASHKKGPAVDKALKAILAIRDLDQVRGNDYEVRVLRIPGQRTEVFWLKAKPFQHGPVRDDLVFPYISFAKAIPEGALLPMATYVANARQLSAREIELRYAV